MGKRPDHISTFNFNFHILDTYLVPFGDSQIEYTVPTATSLNFGIFSRTHT